MSTLAIVLGAVALATLIFGITAIVSVVCKFGEHDNLLQPFVITVIGAVGFYLCLVI